MLFQLALEHAVRLSVDLSPDSAPGFLDLGCRVLQAPLGPLALLSSSGLVCLAVPYVQLCGSLNVTSAAQSIHQQG